MQMKGKQIMSRVRATTDLHSASFIKIVKRKIQNTQMFLIYLAANFHGPFGLKKKVFSADVLYKCEYWLLVPLNSIESFYSRHGERFN